MKNNQSNKIIIDATDNFASIFSNHDSLISMMTPYVIALASIIASCIIGYFSYRASTKAVETSRKIGEATIKAQDKARYMETISKERTKWIDKVREVFSQYNRKGYEFSIKLANTDFDNITTEDEIEFSKMDSEMQLEYTTILLFLNPTEKTTNAIIKCMNTFSRYLSNCYYEKQYVDFKITNEMLKIIVFLQNVILKSEWKRVKREVELGRELTKIEINKIFKEVGENMDENYYKKYLNNDSIIEST